MKELLEKWEKFLTESGLSRLYQHMMDYDSAIISAFRNEYTNKQNYERSRELKAQLLSAGYGVTKIDGSYIENFETPEAIEVSEQSLFISNRGGAADFINEIARLGEEYEQDSVLIIPEGGQDAYLLGTRQGNDFPPFGQQITVGNVKMGGEAEFMSRVKGRPFVFDEPVVETYEKLSKNSRWAVKKLVERAKKRNTKQ
tara:strand:+ start:3199 stop:3795 length:597 start_codon:yes stop_codon:yes gene_type:complete